MKPTGSASQDSSRRRHLRRRHKLRRRILLITVLVIFFGLWSYAVWRMASKGGGREKRLVDPRLLGPKTGD